MENPFIKTSAEACKSKGPVKYFFLWPCGEADILYLRSLEHLITLVAGSHYSLQALLIAWQRQVVMDRNG